MGSLPYDHPTRNQTLYFIARYTYIDQHFTTVFPEQGHQDAVDVDATIPK